MYRKLLTPVLVLVVLVTACGTSVNAAPVVPTPTQTNTPMPTTAATKQPFSATDAYGNTITFATAPKRIVSLAPSTTELLFAVGAGNQVVGRDSYSDYPPEATRVSDIGGGTGDLNTEAVLALNPDLVLAAELTSSDQVKTLEGLGLTVFVVPNPQNFDGLYADINLVGQMSGHADVAAELVASDKKRVASVEQKLSGITYKPLVFYELDATDPSAPWTAGAGTFVDTLINMAGGRNVGASLSGDWAQISTENLLIQNPDIILLGDNTWGGITPKMVSTRPGWDALAAVKDGHVYPFDDNLVSRPGPRLVDGLEALAKLIHPDLFK
jgi:iron complex transport system substrate-binding protein